MSVLLNPIPALGTKSWEPQPELHEFLFGSWIMDAHARGLWFDFHLPQSTASVATVDQEIGRYLSAVIGEIDISELSRPVLANEGDKWRAFSGMQKALRRGKPLMAWRATHALLASGVSTGMWRRLMVTALEDIGLADPYLMSMIAKLVTDKKFRAEVGEKEALWWAVQRMCAAPKSRDLCDVVVYCFLPGQVDAEFGVTVTCDDDELISRAADQSLPFIHRMAAHWRAYGKKFPCSQVYGNPPTQAKGQADRLFEAIALPPLFRHLCAFSYKGVGEALGIPVPFLWQLMLASPKAWVQPDPFENGDERMIKGLYSATFDKHTWQGKAAIRNFLRAAPDLTKFLAETCSGDPLAALERAVFYVEGALLRPRLFFDGAQELFDEVLDAKLRSNGFSSMEAGREFYLLVRDHLDVLHKLRGGS